MQLLLEKMPYFAGLLRADLVAREHGHSWCMHHPHQVAAEIRPFLDKPRRHLRHIYPACPRTLHDSLPPFRARGAVTRRGDQEGAPVVARPAGLEWPLGVPDLYAFLQHLAQEFRAA